MKNMFSGGKFRKITNIFFLSCYQPSWRYQTIIGGHLTNRVTSMVSLSGIGVSLHEGDFTLNSNARVVFDI